MIILLQLALKGILSLFKTRLKLLLENLALRQQLAVLTRSAKRPQLTPSDRMFWVVLFRIWRYWSEALLIVRPETSGPLAPSGVPTVLGLEKPAETRTSPH
jgi:hypothetical protein